MRRAIKKAGFRSHTRKGDRQGAIRQGKFAFGFVACRNIKFLSRLSVFSFLSFIFLSFFIISGSLPARAQQNFGAQFTTSQPASRNYLKNSAAFRQEIMRMEINVARGARVLPITQVPRLQKGDVIKMRLLDEAVNGIKPSESYWNWTFLVAFVNPNRKGIAEGKDSTASEEIQFRKSGWYRQYSFTVPFDSQPVFFLYPKPKYRAQILKLVGRKYEEVRELGEKTIELANAYSQINSFLTELQSVLYRTQSSYYGNFVTYPQLPTANTNPSNPSNPYNPYNSPVYNPYAAPGIYNPPGTTTIGSINNPALPPAPAYNYNAFFEQTVERLAASFNINLPSCWQTNNGGYNYFGTPGGYGGSYNSSYGGSYGAGYGSGYGIGGGNGVNSFGHAVSSEFIGRAQCVAKSIRIEDFDFSVSRLLQEGGIFALTQLRDKYPQFAYYINLAAVAIEFIVKVFQKYPMKVVPTIIQTSDNNGYGSGAGGSYSSASNPYPSSAYPAGASSSLGSANSANFQPVKISVYAEAQPSDSDAVTAYPVVVHKWQSEPDPEIISLAPPVLIEPCLHQGQNILKSTDIQTDESADVFTRDFRLSVSSANGFKKEFPLKKNPGAGGWELNLTNEDLNSFPKISMTLEAEITGTRGFNEVKSPSFVLPINTGNSWQIKAESQKAFAVGGKRVVTLQNMTGTCRCLQAVIYKPSFGGQFVFEANAKDGNNQLQFSPDGKEVSFEIDTANFQPGAGTLEIKTYGDNQPNGQIPNQGNQQNTLPIKLYPPPPEITDFKIAGGDRQAVITGSRLEQLQWVKANGKRMKVVGNPPAANQNGQANQGNQAVAGNQGTTPNFPNSQTSASSVLNQNPNERTLVFEDANTKQEGGAVTLELGLDDDRSFAYPAQFKAAPSRPAIVAGANNEIDGVIVSDGGGNAKPDQSLHSPLTIHHSPLLPLFPVDTKEIGVDVKNALTDYDFKPENLSIETRIENGGANTGEMPGTSFEVFDWKSMRLVITLNEPTSKIIGGRRLQFRLRDRERGDSDWYTIRQTFVRLPEIKSVVCTNEVNGQCEIKGDGIEYLGQVSTDGGRSWYPNENQSLQVRQTADRQSAAMIPLLTEKKLLQIKFRDFPKMDGIAVTNFTFSNSVKAAKKISQPKQISSQSVNAAQPSQPNGNPAADQTPNQPASQTPNSFPNQANSPSSPNPPVQNGNVAPNQTVNNSKPKTRKRRKVKP